MSHYNNLSGNGAKLAVKITFKRFSNSEDNLRGSKYNRFTRNSVQDLAFINLCQRLLLKALVAVNLTALCEILILMHNF